MALYLCRFPRLMKKSQIDSLTATRAFAAIMVFIYHFGRAVYPFSLLPDLFGGGNTAVSYFFVLSGFVLYISYCDKQFSYKSFIVKRLVRIGPAYYAALAVSVWLYFFFYKMGYSPDFLWQLGYSILFMQADVPGYALSLNTAAWSISVEMFFYLLFPLILYVQRKSIRYFLVFSILLYLVTEMAYIRNFRQDFSDTQNFMFYVYHPVIHLHEFLIGMVGGYLFRHSKVKMLPRFPLPLFLTLLVIALFALRPISPVYFQGGLLAPLFMILIWSFAVYNPVFLNFRAFVFVGEISYGMYILQFPVRESMLWANRLWLRLPDTAFFYCSFGVLCLVAAASYYWLEMPLRRLLINRKPQLSLRNL